MNEKNYNFTEELVGKETFGIVIFIDIDNYMSFTKDYNLTQECNFAFEIYSIIAKAATKHKIEFSRIFGDGFLLFSEISKNENMVRERCMSFLENLYLDLKNIQLTFKVSVVLGPFFMGYKNVSDVSSESFLCGFTVNLAGKAIKKCRENEIVFLWPADKIPTTFNNYLSQVTLEPIGLASFLQINNIG